jgi:hypothetical protein
MDSAKRRLYPLFLSHLSLPEEKKHTHLYKKIVSFIFFLPSDDGLTTNQLPSKQTPAASFHENKVSSKTIYC